MPYTWMASEVWHHFHFHWTMQSLPSGIFIKNKGLPVLVPRMDKWRHTSKDKPCLIEFPCRRESAECWNCLKECICDLIIWHRLTQHTNEFGNSIDQWKNCNNLLSLSKCPRICSAAAEQLTTLILHEHVLPNMRKNMF